jgi:hypothetical protein
VAEFNIPLKRDGLAGRRAAKSSGANLNNEADRGEAILEAFRRLKVDDVISSPGSQWPSFWEAPAPAATEPLRSGRALGLR